MPTVFVTGASGFIGNRLVAELVRRGVNCRCLVRATSKVESLRDPLVELIPGAIDQPETYASALEGCETVIHLAGLTHALQPAELFRINGDACGMLADACRAVTIPPRLVYVSSVAAAGPPPRGKTIREEGDPPNPISEYGRSKRQGEIELQRRAGDLSITVLRPGIVCGPGDAKLAEMIRSIYRWRLHVVVGFRTPPLSLIHVDDLVQLILVAAERGETLRPEKENEASSEGYYFACDDSEFPTYWEFGQRVARAFDRRVFVWPLWRWVGRSVAFSAETASRLRKRPSFLSVDKVREATVRSWASSAAKARHQLGFAPARPLDEYLPELVDWYVKNEWV